jgi:hypothetical protein
VDFLCSGALVRAVSTGAFTLYQHLGPAQHPLLRPVFGLCWNALGLGNALLARRHHYLPRGIRYGHCWRLAGSPESPITFEVWTHEGIWFWSIVHSRRNCGAVGAAATEAEALSEARSSIEEMAIGGPSRPVFTSLRERRMAERD